ncbi:hypothetical protein EXW72_03900 [Pseudomonas sp. BCA14]|uniref:hypothetical protein n=1 Tax=unclassified Pseudomonas TaxID=196821 RepID=UPI00106EE6CD|nr:MULTISPECIES: hypothetical protein [unclassified Pseudomonas]TFF14543.1 hypothetical protein EXW70_08585 [Pseudomonas sp. JMN1]TFF14773.1 hypothetical protein EXW71_00455 [Pseudomonas sp. BCA17]TFF21556.1 hypothetical protein EXW73_21695 [Pseudomonas sp. BCA13]TFF31179.1 hypothetical protein EXW72_03900 [Pseudomonas sp. BCA14]
MEHLKSKNRGQTTFTLTTFTLSRAQPICYLKHRGNGGLTPILLQGAGKITLTGRYASPEGSKLGTGSFDNVNQNFSFSFPATKEGLRDFLKEVGQ